LNSLVKIDHNSLVAILSSESEAAQKASKPCSSAHRFASCPSATSCSARNRARQLLSADAGKRLIPITSFGTIAGEHRRGIEGVVMQKSLLAISAAAVSAMLLSTAPASSQPYPYAFGDTPYTLNWWYYPQIQTGCWKWNWQQYFWNDYCPAYIEPKAYMYHPHSRAVLRTRG
jgi:hypothetical protein